LNEEGWSCRHARCGEKVGLTDAAEAFRLSGLLGKIPVQQKAFVLCTKNHLTEISWVTAWREMVHQLKFQTKAAKQAADVQKNQTDKQEQYTANIRFADKSSRFFREAQSPEHAYAEMRRLRELLRRYADRPWPRSWQLRDSLYDLVSALYSYNELKKYAEVMMDQDLSYRLLRRLYHTVGGTQRTVSFPDAAAAVGLDSNQALGVFDYLTANELITPVTEDGQAVRLTSRGIREIQQSEISPDEPTEHFSPQVIQHNVFNAPVGNVQGPQSHAHVTQNIGASVEGVLREVEKIRQRINGLQLENHAHAVELVDELEQQVQSSKPPRNSIKSLLGELVTTTKDIAVEVAASAISKSLGIN
jgi:hypothetical protein